MLVKNMKIFTFLPINYFLFLFKGCEEMNIDDIVEEFRVATYIHFDQFYNETKKNVFFTIIAIIKDRSVVDDLMQDTYIKFLENISKYQNTSINAYAYILEYSISNLELYIATPSVSLTPAINSVVTIIFIPNPIALTKACFK